MDASAGASKKLSLPSYANFMHAVWEHWAEQINTSTLGSIAHLNWKAGGLALDSFDKFYIARRQMRWLGRVSRMPFDRLHIRRMFDVIILTTIPKTQKCRKDDSYGRMMRKAYGIFWT